MAGPWEKYQTDAKPWEKYAAPKTKEAGIGERFVTGAKASAKRGYLGAKGLISDLTPAERYQAEQAQQQIESAGIPGALGAGAVELPFYAAASAIVPGSGLAGFLGRAGASGLMGAALAPKDRGQAAMQAAGGQALGEVGVGLAGKLLRGPVAQEGVKELYEAGVRPTFAQALGKPYSQLEDIATSAPLVRTSALRAQARGAETFTTAGLQKIIDDLNSAAGGSQLPIAAGGRTTVSPKLIDMDIKAGTEGFADVKQAVKDAYGHLIENTSGELTPQFEQGIEGVLKLSQNLRPQYRQQIEDIITNEIYGRFNPGVRTAGESLKSLDSKLGEIADTYLRQGGDENMVGQAAKELRNQLHMMIEEQNPNARQALQAANNAWFKTKIMEKAMTSGVSDELATPTSVLQALRQKNRPQFATGKMPMQEFARSAQNVLGGRLPDSYTPTRLGMQDVFAAGIAGLPAAAGTYAGGSSLYAPVIQDWLVRQAIKEPGLIKLLGEDIMKSAPYAGAFGASMSTR